MRKKISEKTKIRLWVLAGGRCQYKGCNKSLWLDDLTKTYMNRGYIAHIVAVSPQDARGDKILSKNLATELSNLMLMCDKHHRLIDKEKVAEHPVDLLHEMKKSHEERIEIQTNIHNDMKSHVLFYETNIGQHNPNVCWDKAVNAMLPYNYPAEPRAIEMGLKNSTLKDDTEKYWNYELENLRYWIDHSVKPRIRSGDIKHLSVFAFSTQPLLIELGRLLSDILAAEVYQLHREPSDWKWQRSSRSNNFIIKEPKKIYDVVALNLSLSATINNSRISKVFPQKDISIWSMTIEKPNNDFLKSRKQLQIFRQQFRLLLDCIKAQHGEKAILHVFPAVPVSIAVEIGRVWMPKADLPLRIYDQNRRLDGFVKAIDIENS